MPILDFVNEDVGANSLTPQNITQATAGTQVDLSNGEIDTAAYIDFGTVAAGLTSLVVQLEEAVTTGASWTIMGSIAGVAPQASFTTSGSCVRTKIKGLRTQRWGRVNASTAAGTTISVTLCAGIVAQGRFIATSGNQGGYSRSPAT